MVACGYNISIQEAEAEDSNSSPISGSDAMSNKNQEKGGERSHKRREMGKEGKMGEEEVGGREKQED